MVRNRITAAAAVLLVGLASTAAGAPADEGRKTIGPDVLAAWDAKLKAAAAEAVQGGRSARFDLSIIGRPVDLVALGETGALRLRDGSAALDLHWSNLQPADKKSLALALVRPDDPPADLALAAFWLIAAGAARQAEPLLQRLPAAEADPLRALVGTIRDREIQDKRIRDQDARDRMTALLDAAVKSAEAGEPPATVEERFSAAEKAGAPLDDRALHLRAAAQLALGRRDDAARLARRIAPQYVQKHPEAESILAVLGVRPALPKQFLLFDTVAVHTEDAQMMNVPGFGHLPTFTRSQTVPPNWREPVDFADGSFRILYEVVEKPNRRPIHFCIVMTAPAGAKVQGDLPSHPGSRNFTEPGTDVEEGQVRQHFRGTYQGNKGWADWDWAKPFGRLWQDSYRSKVTSGQDSSQYGPSSVFPVKVRVRMWVAAKGFEYHPFGNVGEIDFRILRFLADGAQLIGQGSLGEALKVAEKASNDSDAGRAEEARWVLRGLNAHAEKRLRELLEYAKEDADVAADELKELAAQYRGHPLGAKLAADAAALDTADATVRCRRAREVWKKVLAESGRIEVPGYVGTEKWDEFIPTPSEVQKKYEKELAAIKAGIDEMLSVYTARNWKRMAMSLLHNLGQVK